MIQRTDIRIGNLVWDDYSGEMIVEGITDDSVNLRKPGFNAIGLYQLKNISPIRITEKYLKRLGFLFTENDTFNSEQNPTHSIVLHKNKFMYCVNGVIIRQVKSAHEIQNVFWAILAEEIIIKQ